MVSTTRRRRPALIALVIVAAAGCLALAWWQWTRFESASGTFQNLGYALQWPLFAGFCVYGYYKFVRYEDAPPEPKSPTTPRSRPACFPKDQSPQHHPTTSRPRTAGVQRLSCRPGRERQGTVTETPTPTTPVETIRKALLGYRVMAWTTGLWLILLCYEMVAKYVYGVEGLNWIAVVHGWVYFIYLLFTANLAVKVRWPIGMTIGVLLAGTIPLVGIIVEHFRTKEIKERFGI